MAVDYHRKLLGYAYSLEFVEWEKQALVPKDLFRTPNELQDRARIAQVMRDLRREQEPELDADIVLQELRALIVKQTKAKNCYEAYQPEEIEALQETVRDLNHWSRLVKLLGQVRAETMRRYDAEMAQQYERQEYSDGWTTAA